MSMGDYDRWKCDPDWGVREETCEHCGGVKGECDREYCGYCGAVICVNSTCKPCAAARVESGG